MWLSAPPDEPETESHASRVVLVLAICFFTLCLIHAAHSVMCCGAFQQLGMHAVTP